ncbi:6-aminohexanoate-dimer hydrolase [Roseomonas mucosa]|uniref:serine hydrolase domain-containing protein n=1 Tax=Roseomonas TaxID=125216 RepID=UPI000C19B456|nr:MULTISPECIES: serine hydrolase [Roseomonas]ATR22018.1 serine hydrolase [Roseomonas sp. FDAARGOS_362]QDJ08116.1 6-aminohexanoate-dimer hydrolase [Roseomonas mucosa]UZO95490.1 6-aminohexanoate-dimer hydrolase [Roseomonas mucosa]
MTDDRPSLAVPPIRGTTAVMNSHPPFGVPWSSPAAAGFDPTRFARVLNRAQSLGSEGLLVLREGRAVGGMGNPAWKANIRSIRKSILCALIGMAVAEGRMDLSATLESLGIDDREGLSPMERGATVYDLLTARSGIMHPAGYESDWMKQIKPPRHAHPPGTRWTYNNWDFNALGTIYERATGQGIPEAFAGRLAAPLGMEDFAAGDAFHVPSPESLHPAYPIRLSARDLARFGQLWLQEGRWGEEQLVPADWVRASVRPVSDAGDDGAYGYMWWLCRDGIHLPGVILPRDACSARGWGGHFLLVVPSLDLVVVHRAQTETEPFRTVSKPAMGLLTAALLDSLV